VSGTSKKHPASAASSPPVTPTSQQPVVTPTSAQPTGSTAASSAKVNIYNWLPFTQQALASASGVVIEFSAYYGTYSYNDPTSSYTGRMQGLATSQLIQVIASGYAAPGVASLRNQEKQVSAGSAAINSIRVFGPTSITFVVTVNQKITTNHGPSQQGTQYAVTVANSSGSWQVSDIELASTGNL
jgi:hypothetical protein